MYLYYHNFAKICDNMFQAIVLKTVDFTYQL